MTDMIERIARAICEYQGRSWGASDGDLHDRWRGMARAALRELMEPTPEMVCAAVPHVTSAFTPAEIDTAQKVVLMLEPRESNIPIPAKMRIDLIAQLVRDFSLMIRAAAGESENG